MRAISRITTTLLAAWAVAACEPKPSQAPQPAPAPQTASAKPVAPAPAEPAAPAPAEPAAASVLDLVVETIDGTPKKLADYQGKALLIVNTASECGFTPQYADLQRLYATYQPRGLEVLAFPSNDFGAQEPGTAEEIKKFTSEKFSVEFPLFAKVATKGEGQSPLYARLTQESPEGMRGDVKWNFTKFLVDRRGHIVGRFESPVKPLDPKLVAAVEAALAP